MEHFRFLHTKSPSDKGFSCYCEHFNGRDFIRLEYLGDSDKVEEYSCKVSRRYLLVRYNSLNGPVEPREEAEDEMLKMQERDSTR